tara:strand:+ start:150 stop:590 length:441 start_codon:yes stop_codon:yes gene_type:complete
MNKRGSIWVLDYFYLFMRLVIFSLVFMFVALILTDYINRDVDVGQQKSDLVLERALSQDCFGSNEVNGVNIDKFTKNRLKECMVLGEDLGVKFSLAGQELIANEDMIKIYLPACGDALYFDCYSRELPVLVDDKMLDLKFEMVVKT